MYPNLRAEMARKNVTVTELAKDPGIDCTVGTMSLKVNCKAPISLKEAVAIKAILKTSLTLEELFEEAEG